MRKILVSLLVVSMLLGLVGTAYAGGFSDTTDSYVNKAAAYGWVGGYADGTFKPEANITRAEAAKMMVNALGLSAAADAAKGLAPKFSDVAASHWASGYINVCVAQGVLKGYADGTFKPEANITGAEIVTMIVRGLKRESEAIGDWPVGHVTVAAANNIIGTGFAASALATRVDVAKWLVKAAAVNTLKLESTGWVDSGKTWVTGKFDIVTGSVSKVDAAKSHIYVVGTEYDLATGYTVGGGKTLADLVGRVCTLTRDVVDDEIEYVEIKTDVVVKTGTVSVVGADYFYLDSDTTKYTVGVATAPNLDLIMYENGTRTVNKDVATLVGAIAKDDEIEFYANASGVVTFIKLDVFTYDNNVITDVTTTTTPNTISLCSDGDGVAEVTLYVPSTAVITLNGATAAVADLDDDMFVNVAVKVSDSSAVAYLNATNKSVEGKATAVRATYGSTNKFYVTVDGVEYALALGDDNANIAGQTAMLNNTTTLYLNLDGKVQSYATKNFGTPYGKVISFELDGTGTGHEYTKWNVDIKGVTTVYEIKDGDHTTLIGAPQSIAAGSYVKLGFDATGRIDPATTVKLTLGGTIYEINSVYTGATDSLIILDDGVNPDISLVATSKTVVYINGVAKTVADLTKDNSIKYVLDAATGKVAVAYSDTILTYNSGYVISPVAGQVKCLAGGIEKNSKITFYSDAFRTVAVNATVVGADGVQGAANEVTTSADGTFTATIAGAGTTVYVTITDPYFNTTNAAWTVTR